MPCSSMAMSSTGPPESRVGAERLDEPEAGGLAAIVVPVAFLEPPPPMPLLAAATARPVPPPPPLSPPPEEPPPELEAQPKRRLALRRLLRPERSPERTLCTLTSRRRATAARDSGLPWMPPRSESTRRWKPPSASRQPLRRRTERRRARSRRAATWRRRCARDGGWEAELV